VSLALLDYESAHGHLPPAVVYGYDGQPLYSWRVLVLPYIEQDALYKQFHLDEPWDSPHNIALLEKMPHTYEAPGSKKSKVPPYHTVCHVFVGKGTAFEGREGLRSHDFPNGTSNTLLVIEAGEPVPWTKPADLVYDPDGPLPELPLLFRDGFRMAFADGSTRWVKKEISEATLRAIITRNFVDLPSSDW
jgi:Protein of unknown function (DUF1559)